MSLIERLASPLLATLILILPVMALADPPARVGRLAYIENTVDIRLERGDAPAPATRNWPISSGAVLETGERGRAEVWIDSTAFRLGADSEVEFASIDDDRMTLEVANGRLAISIMESEQANDLLVRLPEGNVRFARAGRYRLDVGPQGSEVTTLAGLASIEKDGERTQLQAGNRATLFVGGGLRVEAADRADSFDRWVAERENATQAPVARRHVSPYMTGYQDLDAYGDWNRHDEYGSVWYPRAVANDWAPYRFGRWAWVSPWGWTWIDAAPWGFAPFHYGRWVLIHGRWAWVPGQRTVRPVYAPALVAWIGDPGWSVSFSFGSAPAVGWFPLAPREVYVPYYRYSPTYIRRINVTHVHNVTIIDRAARERHHDRFVHRSSPQAVTVVPANRLREGREINERDFRRVDAHDLRRAPVPTAAVAGKEWLAPAPEARRPRVDDRRERLTGGGPRDAERTERPKPTDRLERRGEPDVRRLDAGAAERPPARRDERRDDRRDERRDDSSRAVRSPEPAVRPAPQAVPERPPERVVPPVEREPRREFREERRDERRSIREPVREEAPPVRELRREPREVMRPPPELRQDDNRGFRRAEPEAPRPVMRPPEPRQEAPREPRGGREPSEHRGRGEERGERGPR